MKPGKSTQTAVIAVAVIVLVAGLLYAAHMGAGPEATANAATVATAPEACTGMCAGCPVAVASGCAHADTVACADCPQAQEGEAPVASVEVTPATPAATAPAEVRLETPQTALEPATPAVRESPVPAPAPRVEADLPEPAPAPAVAAQPTEPARIAPADPAPAPAAATAAHVDQDACIGCGRCVDAAPDAFGMNSETGRAFVKPGASAASIEAGAAACPVDAVVR